MTKGWSVKAMNQCQAITHKTGRLLTSTLHDGVGLTLVLVHGLYAVLVHSWGNNRAKRDKTANEASSSYCPTNDLSLCVQLTTRTSLRGLALALTLGLRTEDLLNNIDTDGGAEDLAKCQKPPSFSLKLLTAGRATEPEASFLFQTETLGR